MGYGRTGLSTLRWFSKINEFPLILGREFSGIVRQKGDKVRDDIQIGDKVMGLVSPQVSERVVVQLHLQCISTTYSNF